MRTTDEDFKIFKEEFIKWQKKLGLQGYDVTFVWQKDYKNYASIIINQDARSAIVTFTKSVVEKYKDDFNPKALGKHEALHLLIHRIYDLGRRRFVCQDELFQEWEKLVVILEKVL